MSFSGIYSLVFIVEAVAAMFGASPRLYGDLRGTKQLRAVSHENERRTPVAPEVTAVVTPRVMTDDEGRRRDEDDVWTPERPS